MKTFVGRAYHKDVPFISKHILQPQGIVVYGNKDGNFELMWNDLE